MRYLFIDTASSNLIITIVENNKLIYNYIDSNNSDTSSKVMPIIDEAFSKTNLDVKDINKIFVVTGPGSFTGIRVGVTIAKTIGFCLNIPIIEISELELLATKSTNKEYNIPIIDARRGYVYGAIYDKNLNAIVNDRYILLSDLEKQYPSNYEIINQDNKDLDLLKIISKHEFDEGVNAHNLNPNYLKKTEAEEKLSD